MLRDIEERVTNPLAEARVDEENRIVRSVAILATRFSDNGHEYSSKSLDTLTHLVNGANVFLNHQSKSEMRDRERVRDIRDWAGVLDNAKRFGDKVVADFHVQDEKWPLVKSIAELTPHKIGFSINSRVWIEKIDSKEIVTDIDHLYAADLVSSGATIESIFESLDTKRKVKEKEIEDPKVGTIIQIRESDIAIDVGESEPLYVPKRGLSFVPRISQEVALTYGGTKEKQESKNPVKKKEVDNNMLTLIKETTKMVKELNKKAEEEDLQEKVLDAVDTSRSPKVEHTYDWLPDEKKKEPSTADLLEMVTHDKGITNVNQKAEQINEFSSPEAVWNKKRLQELKVAGKPKSDEEAELLKAVIK